jgi:hypothetical protein
MKQHMRGSLKTEGIGLGVRNALAQGYGLAWGEFEILNGMQNEYAQGIYGKPGRHEALVRFSNGTNHVGGDPFLGPITGIGLKNFGIKGKLRWKMSRTVTFAQQIGRIFGGCFFAPLGARCLCEGAVFGNSARHAYSSDGCGISPNSLVQTGTRCVVVENCFSVIE